MVSPALTLDPAAIRAELDHLLVTSYFKTSPRLRRFLAYTVDQVLSGSEHGLKEYTIALEVFGKPDSFDPRVDSAVRVAARQLRAKLDIYYLNEGAQDEILIRFRPGGYIPRFYRRTPGVARPNAERSAARIVVAEKDRSTSAAIADALDNCNATVLGIVDSGEAALDLVLNCGATLLISGISLSGGMTGLDLVRPGKPVPHPPVILVVPTVLTDELFTQIAETNPAALLFKPVRAADVNAAIQLASAKRNLAFYSGQGLNQQGATALSA